MTRIRTSRLAIAAVLGGSFVVATASAAQAADWGTIKGKFVYKGDAKAVPIDVTKDVEFCSEHHPMDETLVVGDDNALENVFVYLYVARGKKVAIHPDFKPGEPKVLANKGCRFEPHAMTLWNAEEFEVKNEDPGIGHNTNFNLAGRTEFNLTVPNDAPIKRKFASSGPIPASVSCNIHPWMHAFVLVRDNPYMAVTGKDGTFEIKNVPAGKQEFIFWHESHGFLRDLEVGKEKADRKGQVEVTVPADDVVDLGVIEVTPDLLGK